MTFTEFSVVVPTLGGEALFRTVDFINSGSSVPNEILICIPEEFSYRVEKLTVFQNIKIIKTKCKGQVLQRIEGFKQVRNDYVVQMDDDMYVYETCLERLIEGLNKFEEKVSIAPAMVFDSTRVSCYLAEHKDSLINNIIHGKNWFKPGSITKSGINIGMNVFLNKERFSTVDWLPGGCVAHNKRNLILHDYFPFKGKAFYEDIIHSIHLTNNNVKLVIDNLAICGIDEYEKEPLKLFITVSTFNKHFPYRKHILNLKAYPRIHLILDGLYNYLLTVKIFLYLIYNVFKKVIDKK